MESVDGLLKSLEIKTQQFAELYVKIKEERDQLINQTVTQRNTIETQNREIENLKTQVQALEIAKSVTSAEDTGGVKDRIRDLVREIDRCIELLNK